MPMLLVVEDNEDMLTEVEAIGNDQGWQVRTARCVEEALVEVESQEGVFDCVLVDIMLPDDQERLRQVDELLEERARVVRDSMGQGFGENLTDEVAWNARIKVGDLDERIERLMDMRGGVCFVEKARDRLTTARVVVFSARAPTELDALGTLRANIENILGGRLHDWWQKPVEPDQIARLLDQIGSSKGTGNHAAT